MFELKSVFETLFKFDLAYIWIGFENKIEKENSLFLLLGPKAFFSFSSRSPDTRAGLLPSIRWCFGPRQHVGPASPRAAQ